MYAIFLRRGERGHLAASRKQSMWLVLGAQALSTMGSSVTTVALAVMVFQRTGSVLHMGGILAASTLPVVVMSFVGGALLDRYPSRALMVLADVVRAGLVLAFPFAAGVSVGLIYAVAAVMGVFTSMFNPSQIKLISDLVPTQDLMKANSYLSIARDGAELGGYLAGGALVASVGYFTTFTIDAATYALSALLLIWVPSIKPRDSRESFARLLKESPQALARLWERPVLRANTLYILLPMAFVMMNTPNAYGLALEVYDRGPQGLAAMEVVTAAGWILGGILASRINYKGDRNAYTVMCGTFIGICLVGVGLVGSFWASVGLLSLAAVANVGVIVGSMTLFQEIEPRPDKGRIIALRAGLGQLGGAAGLFLGGVLGNALGISNLYLLAGGGAIVLGGAVFLPYLRWKRRNLVPVLANGPADTGMAQGGPVVSEGEVP
ncbi:MAG: MFS transporter [Actinobacteria bacterium]|nr:MFS transporter [Actinomycetota bacterium]